VRGLRRRLPRVRARVDVGDDADNLRYDQQHKRLYVGYGAGAIGVIDVESWKVVERIELAGHPESFQLDQETSRTFVNVPDAHQVAVIDLAQHALLAKWKVDEASANFPMALLADSTLPEDGLVLLGCRSPARLVLRSMADRETRRGARALGRYRRPFYDAARQRILAICGEGYVDVLSKDGEAFQRLTRFPPPPERAPACSCPRGMSSSSRSPTAARSEPKSGSSQ
jgi:hypothetical protein